jgi:hypothetical protein
MLSLLTSRGPSKITADTVIAIDPANIRKMNFLGWARDGGEISEGTRKDLGSMRTVNTAYGGRKTEGA